MTPTKMKLKNEAEGLNKLNTTSLQYSNVTSTLKVPLTFNKVEKRIKNFNFVHLLSSSTSIAQKVHVFCKFKYTKRMPS